MPATTEPTFDVPAGACDCHMHVFGPHGRYPLSANRTYTPPDATVAEYQAMAATLGLERVVLVQPSPYGADNRCMLAAMAAIGRNARGVAVIDAGTSEAELTAMNAAGVRGARVNAETFGMRDPGPIERELGALARRIAPLGWHLQLFASPAVIAGLAPTLPSLEVPVVIDHMGLAGAPAGASQAGFDALLRLVSDGAWVKLSGADRLARTADYSDVAPIARALIAANPDRVVWGSDWPHTGHAGRGHGAAAPLVPFRSLDDGALLSLLAAWTSDAAARKRMLVDNPARLYGFESVD